MYKKNIFFVLLVVLIAAFLIDNHAAADSAVRQNRLDILNNIKESVSVSQGGQMYRTKHFNIFIDKESADGYNVADEDRFEALMLRICYIFEEAHSAMESMISAKFQGKIDVVLYEPSVFMRQYGRNEPYYLYYRGSRARICVWPEAFADPLDGFEDGIASLYRIFARVFSYGRWGSSLSPEDAQEFRFYFGEIGKASSGWIRPLDDQQRQRAIDEVDSGYSLLFKKYPKIFAGKKMYRAHMICRWCRQEMDVTGLRKNTRIKCPHCGKTVTVE